MCDVPVHMTMNVDACVDTELVLFLAHILSFQKEIEPLMIKFDGINEIPMLIAFAEYA